MKTFLKRFIALTLAVICFAAPSIAKAASVPTITYNDGDLVVW